MIRGFKEVSKEHKQHNCTVQIPVKATRNSAGYDFFCPIDLEIPPQSKVSFYTDIKSYMGENEALLMFPRSSTGIKHDLELANSVVVGDGDFYENPDNDGNYKIVLWNRRPKFDWDGDEEIIFMDQYGQPIQVTIPFMIDLTEENTVHVKAGDRLVQGLFIKTLPADEGQSDVVRTGGIGHTGK